MPRLRSASAPSSTTSRRPAIARRAQPPHRAGRPRRRRGEALASAGWAAIRQLFSFPSRVTSLDRLQDLQIDHQYMTDAPSAAEPPAAEVVVRPEPPGWLMAMRASVVLLTFYAVVLVIRWAVEA